MGISLSTARWLAPLSFAVDFGVQQYGMLSSPNMKDIHDAHLSFFSPQPFFIAGFFGPQQILQLVWLYKLYKAKPEDASTDPHVRGMIEYTPFYALGNFCIAAWLFFWNSEALTASNVLVTINTLSQLYFYAARLPPADTTSTISMLTHSVCATFAGIGVLDLLHNGSVAFADYGRGPVPDPGLAVKVLTGVGFGAAAAGSEWIMGGSLAYDLVAMSVGQRMYNANKGWGDLLGWYALGTAGVVIVKNVLKWPYVRGSVVAL